MRSIRSVLSLLFTLVLFALVTLAMPYPSFAQFGVLISIVPPELPVYEQPVIPGPGYLWTPGYWAWSPENGGYYWVPGNTFIWNPGYWGPHIGFYGGVNYGFGYTGSGYEGGY